MPAAAADPLTTDSGSSDPESPPQQSTRILWSVTAFAVAFGWVEAAVVVYLRELLYPDGFAFPMRLLRADLGMTELVREAATIVMLAAVAFAGARSAWGRFGLFALAFGVWDLVYYAGLYAALGWPESLATWDVLFLIPGVWTGPVWSAGLIAVLLIAFGIPIYRRGETGTMGPPRRWHWLVGGVSLLLIIGAFLANHAITLAQDIPSDFPELPYFLGVALGIAAALDLLRAQAAPAGSGS